ncbi:Transcriptional regulatory protein OmpR [Pseudogemmobacter humi]|uniref:Transcriptional regulatory protein OmpR n=2 Tax=Pseudogemmobacter humi TaxID=2483812 RepID=A0A3P5XFA5_9RHOB|nr:Transcriptional regulatory protein OmpR [Pseudogemmobacter humi]
MYLQRNGMTVSVAESALAARKIIVNRKFDVILLDIMMPGEDGLSFCRYISENREIPIIFLTALHSDANKIRGLDIGADDYITKPFNPRELLARINAVMRRRVAASEPPEEIAVRVRRRFLAFTHDPQIRVVHVDGGEDIILTTGENRLLEAMLEQPGRVFRRDDISGIIRGPKVLASARAADNCVFRLRRKLGDNARAPKLIITEWGGGYRLNADVAEVA